VKGSLSMAQSDKLWSIFDKNKEVTFSIFDKLKVESVKDQSGENTNDSLTSTSSAFTGDDEEGKDIIDKVDGIKNEMIHRKRERAGRNKKIKHKKEKREKKTGNNKSNKICK
jgi:hypothetical protein